MKKCFIICPIGSENSEERAHSDKLLTHVISPICEDNGFEPIRIDQENQPGAITESILEHLQTDELVIADITKLNPNAFYEIGYRTATGRPIIHIKSKDCPIPFDVSAVRTFDYDITDLDSVAELKMRLSDTIQSIEFSDSENIKEVHEDSTFNTKILQVLFSLQDDIRELKDISAANDTKVISVLADKLQTSNAVSPEIEMMKIMVDNPEKLKEFLNTASKFPSFTSQK